MFFRPKIKMAGGNDKVIIPSKEEENGGFDIYANFRRDYILLNPHQTVMIPTNLKSAFSKKWVIVFYERGKLQGTKGLGQRCGVIDSGYRDFWFVPITNHNDFHMIIAKKDFDYSKLGYAQLKVYPYEKAICQMMVHRNFKSKIESVSCEEIDAIPSKKEKVNSEIVESKKYFNFDTGNLETRKEYRKRTEKRKAIR